MLKLISTKSKGTVYLVGAGTGDPDLLTIKALRIIETADVIFYDRLISAEIRKLFPVSTPIRYVGKASGQHAVPQDQINRLMIDAAMNGLNVCRLKGGDPFVFGRGSEEMLVLTGSNIKVEVIPGITAASGCTSYAGIPLTHRGISQSCTFVAGHGANSVDIAWSALAQLKQTLVFYMGLTTAGSISKNLTSNGLDITTPVAVIEKGSTSKQRVIIGKLYELEDMIRWHQVQSPGLIVVGNVVDLAPRLQWFQLDGYTEYENHQELFAAQDKEIGCP